jgi:hypothetical protein
MKVLISLPDELCSRMRATIPQRQRSKVIADLVRGEVERREQELYQVALAVKRRDENLNAEMAEWEVTTGDGIEAEPWQHLLGEPGPDSRVGNKENAAMRPQRCDTHQPGSTNGSRGTLVTGC